MTVHGTARFATRGEVEQAGLIGDWASYSLLLGWWYESEYNFLPITYAGDLHQIIVGGTGGGKFTTAIAPLLLGSLLEDSTVVVVDPKGEIAKLAGVYYQKPFAKEPSVFVVDPWDVCGTGASARVNVLDTIRPDNPNYVDDARALADAMIISSGAENTHWDNAARNFLTGVILYVALHPDEEGKRDLTRVRDIITLTWAMPKAYTGPKRPTLSELMFKHLASDLADGAVRRAFSTLLNREDKERSGIISSIERDTAWIDSPPMAAMLKGPSLNLREGVQEGRKYFIVLPPDYFMTHRAWLRLMVTAFAKAMKRNPPAKDRPTDRRWRHIVIDEFATLGEMPFMLNEVAIARGFDVKYHFAVQDLAQLRREYKDGWESFINNSFQRFFAVSDLFTADYVSRMLGAATVVSTTTGVSDSKTYTQSYGTSESTSDGYSTPPGIFRFSTSTGGSSTSTSTGYSTSQARSTSHSASQVQRPLLTPDEVRRLDGDEQILFMRQMHPIRCWRPPYWEIFPSLPSYTLQDVLGTVGREPVDEAERKRFTDWRDGPFLMRPKKMPESPPPVRALEGPVDQAKPFPWRRAAGIAAAILLSLWLFWPRDHGEELRVLQAREAALVQRYADTLVDNAIADEKARRQRVEDESRRRAAEERARQATERWRAQQEEAARAKEDARKKVEDEARKKQDEARAEEERMRDPAYRQQKRNEELRKLDEIREAAVKKAQEDEDRSRADQERWQQKRRKDEAQAAAVRRAYVEKFAHLGFGIFEGKGLLSYKATYRMMDSAESCAIACLASISCGVFAYARDRSQNCQHLSAPWKAWPGASMPAEGVFNNPIWVIGLRLPEGVRLPDPLPVPEPAPQPEGPRRPGAPSPIPVIPERR